MVAPREPGATREWITRTRSGAATPVGICGVARWLARSVSRPGRRAGSRAAEGPTGPPAGGGVGRGAGGGGRARRAPPPDGPAGGGRDGALHGAELLRAAVDADGHRLSRHVR